MKAGDRIRVELGYGQGDYTVEEFRYCLGFFKSSAHRRAGMFTPLCELYEPGPTSALLSSLDFGEYYTNEVQSWMDIP